MAPSGRPRVFLDTNVLLSGLHSPAGPPAHIVRMHIEGKILAVVSRLVLDEMARAVADKLPDIADTLRRFLMTAPPLVVPDASDKEIAEWSARIGDPLDAPILAAAVSSAADFFVTGDRNLLAAAKRVDPPGMAVVSPRELLAALE